MLASSNKDIGIFSGKVRVRVCGLLDNGTEILMIKHNSIGSKGHIWLPPGGGVDFGESAEKTLKREFLEETGLNIEVNEFLFVYELVNDKHHAIELFYRVTLVDGELTLGIDPELDAESQILEEIAFLTYEEIGEMDAALLHSIFNEVNTPEKLFELRGLFSFKH